MSMTAKKRSASSDKEEIFRALCKADALRDANELMRLCIMLLFYGHCSSLAAVEEKFRQLSLNAHLIAVPFDALSLPRGVVCTNPFRIESSERVASRNCAFRASLNLEGERAALVECEQHGADSFVDNLNRLRGDCGFLMMKSSNDAQQTWRSAISEFAGHVQRADDRATLVTGLDSCKTCGRFQTSVTELRPLQCCADSVVCSEQCWAAHIEQEHTEVAVFASSSSSMSSKHREQ